MVASFQTHLQTGLTQLCQCWAITRQDGKVFGFTDHDVDLSFDQITFAANSGLSARALSETTGLSVNNTEAVGALQSSRLTSADISAGIYDHAQVQIWRVNWSNVAVRDVVFRGFLGEMTRSGPAFQVELRGLTQSLNTAQGRSYLKGCSARLGDQTCGVDVSDSKWSTQVTLGANAVSVNRPKRLELPAQPYDAGWFSGGWAEVLSGLATGVKIDIVQDQTKGGLRVLTLAGSRPEGLQAGSSIRLVAGCDKGQGTCAEKFKNILNFQGFPHIPGEDWLVSVPRANGDNSGRSLKA